MSVELSHSRAKPALHGRSASFETRRFATLLRMRKDVRGKKKEPHAEEAALSLSLAVLKHARRLSDALQPPAAS